jgi:hypothetical protein
MILRFGLAMICAIVAAAGRAHRLTKLGQAGLEAIFYLSPGLTAASGWSRRGWLSWTKPKDHKAWRVSR